MYFTLMLLSHGYAYYAKKTNAKAKQSNKKAIYWHTKAAKQGNTFAEYRLKIMNHNKQNTKE